MSALKLFDLTGRKAIVTGGSRGLGLQIARALGEAGAELVIASRKADELEATAKALAEQGITAHARPLPKAHVWHMTCCGAAAK